MKSRIVILLDKFTQTLEEKIARENPEYIPTEAGILKQDFMQQKMVEWADTVILPSDDMLQFAIENGWQLPADTRIVKYMSSVKSPKRVNSKPWKSKAKEFLFVGPLSEMRGLTIFADALDYLAEWSVKKDLPNFKVRFAGEISTVKGISSDDYLQLRSTQVRRNFIIIKVYRDSNLFALFLVESTRLDTRHRYGLERDIDICSHT